MQDDGRGPTIMGLGLVACELGLQIVGFQNVYLGLGLLIIAAILFVYGGILTSMPTIRQAGTWLGSIRDESRRRRARRLTTRAAVLAMSLLWMVTFVGITLLISGLLFSSSLLRWAGLISVMLINIQAWVMERNWDKLWPRREPASMPNENLERRSGP